MNAKELIKFVGCRALHKSGDFAFQVEILDAREEWHKMELLIKPIAGTGEAWVPSWVLEIQDSPEIQTTHVHLDRGKK